MCGTYPLLKLVPTDTYVSDVLAAFSGGLICTLGFLLLLWSHPALSEEPESGREAESPPDLSFPHHCVVCFFVPCIFMYVRPWMWELDYKVSWALKNWCIWTVVLEKTLESPFDCKEIQPVHPKGDQSWVFIGRWWSWNSNTLAIWCKQLTHLKKPWWWERLRAGGEEDDRGWDGWIASLTRWTWVWMDFRSWWWTGRPGVLWFMGSQRVGHDWATELNC